MTDAQIAFFIGLFGSVHCIGMCGPLMLAVPVNSQVKWLILWDKLLYQIGRTISYVILGVIVGLIGRQLWMANLLNGISIVSGILIILAALSKLLKASLRGPGFTAKLAMPINRLLAYALKQRSGHLLIGMLNGLLPCGFVYLALIGAVNTAAVQASAAFMFWFGIGTMPLLYIATVSAGFVNKGFRAKLNKIAPCFMLALGIWFIVRGLALNIPYLSPDKATSTEICR